MNPTLRASFLAAALALATACGGTSRSASPLVENIDEITRATGEGDFQALVDEGNAQWENRLELEALQAAIAAWEQAITVETPADVDRNEALFPVYVSLSRANYFLADAHVRWSSGSDAEMAESYAVGMEYGAQAIALGNEEWTRALVYETPVPEAVSTLTRDDMPAVYWYATNAGRWALATSIAEVLARKDDIAAMMGRLLELWPEFFYGAPNRYFGVYYTKIPFGDPALDMSLTNFEAAMAAFPQYLDNFFLFAADYCRVTNNRERAIEALETVLAFDVSAVPEVIPENTNAQRKAQDMLDNIDEYFN